jgi:hypothetical protein
MSSFSHIVSGRDAKTVVDAIYYVGRYIKQAEHLGELEKDIFEDDERSEPTQEVKDLAWEIIAAVEEEVGMPAAEFDESTLINVMDQLAEAEAALTNDLTPDQLKEVKEVIERMQPPIISG